MDSRADNDTGPGGAVAAVLVVGAVVGAVWLVADAAIEPPHVSISGSIIGPCSAQPSSTVEVYADGELAGSGWVSQWDGVGTWCEASISVNSVDHHDVYTLTTGDLTGTVKQSRLRDMMTIRLWRKDL